MASTSPPQSTFYIVATPIGNLDDLTFRALGALKRADLIACEDTRRTLKLLNHYGIQKPLITIFGPREEKAVPKILRALDEGKSVALVTDAGTPGLSDPGNALVRAVRAAGRRVEPVPGISALACALSVSGLADRGCVFLGFLPRSPNKIRKAFRKAAAQGLPIVIFESPYRVVKTLELASDVLGGAARAFVGREMTKQFEEYIEGSIEEVLRVLSGREMLGEFTVAVVPPEIDFDPAER